MAVREQHFIINLDSLGHASQIKELSDSIYIWTSKTAQTSQEEETHGPHTRLNGELSMDRGLYSSPMSFVCYYYYYSKLENECI
jgi:hypothetical protein